MKALCFLGTGKYQAVTYTWVDTDGNAKSYSTELFPEAVYHIFEPSMVYVFVTKEAKERYLPKLQERLKDKLYPVDIPDGKSEGQLWEIFEKCADIVKDGDEIILDITHAFRSLPLIVFTVAMYLRQTKNVTVKHIVYGAFEARDENNCAPIFDLTAMVDLLDWINGVNAFVNYAAAEIFAEKLVHTQKKLRMGGGTISSELPTHLQEIGKKLRTLSLNLHMNRPIEVMKDANDLLSMLGRAQAELQTWAKPFAAIAKTLSKEISELAYAEAEKLTKQNLEKQLAIIAYCIRKNLIIQALTLARELAINCLFFSCGMKDRWLKQREREEIEKLINSYAQEQREESQKDGRIEPSCPDELKASLGRIWKDISTVRNDIAHCGMRESPIRADTAVEKAKGIYDELRRLLDHISE
ncbi:TIGR02221 family CRISPR-associated protein [Pseudothermotoga thermarum]|uniref:CRISPR-associated protein, TM1812 family n=1 Tax=Pseudothermotoga thermarum DSM 5069 TaxID=688269 RepID=F7YTN3_9THEM|nr:TIGR02221 family CRISPR-associated protein [Pseudothermotoga thermarum]AEH51255.1 CRISPR-associated protein, TM1812 family [Pseudothermotoga thermarum DSM 5069]